MPVKSSTKKKLSAIAKKRKRDSMGRFLSGSLRAFSAGNNSGVRPIALGRV